MLGLQLREAFRGAKLQGTTIDFSNDSKTGALDQSAKEFLRIRLFGIPYTEYSAIAALMQPEEIHPEVRQKLDAIQTAFRL